jgi:hypothetical protein
MRNRGVAVGVAVALSADRTSHQDKRGYEGNSHGNLSVSSPHNPRSSGYVTAARLDEIRESLSDRDWAIVRDVASLRLATGKQLERVHFAGLTEPSRAVVRRRVLARLVQTRVLGTLERRIGGVRAGSQGLVYFLDVAGQRMYEVARRGDVPGERYVRHVLAVAELYVSLIEHQRAGAWRLESFSAEPSSWWPDGLGGRIKPDGYIRVSGSDHFDSWWMEVDLATEHPMALKRKLAVYLDFYRRGQLGPDKIMPCVMVTVPDEKRRSEIDRLIRQLPLQAGELFTVALHNDAADLIVRRLSQP